MKIVEYNDMVQSLLLGHDLEFLYKNEKYFLENQESSHELYKMISVDEGILFYKIEGANIKEQVDGFLSLPIFEKPISQIYSKIKILDIE